MESLRISQLKTWERHVNLVLKVFLRALELLQSRTNDGDSEITLNRELYFCLLEANSEIHKSTGEAINHAPTIEGNNPPDADDVQRAVRENKIPDFYWGFIDHAVVNPRRGARNFVIECKRLGKPIRADWVFNENYVHHGVLRFVTEEYAYAKGEKEGAMVGYVHSMNFADILLEVNKTTTQVSVADLEGPDDGWQIGGISHLHHSLTRPFKVSPFYLRHLWVDLRNREDRTCNDELDHAGEEPTDTE